MNEINTETSPARQTILRPPNAGVVTKGGVSNAYREGDISFTEAENLLKNMRNPGPAEALFMADAIDDTKQ